jgi:hypothetical protein
MISKILDFTLQEGAKKEYRIGVLENYQVGKRWCFHYAKVS